MKKLIFSFTLLCCSFIHLSVNGQCAWNPVGPDDKNQPCAKNGGIQIAFDGSGALYSFCGSNFKKFDHNNWIDLNHSVYFPSGMNYVSFTITPSGTPYVLYADANSNNTASVMTYDGFGWYNVGNPGLSIGYLTGSSIALDAAGTPYIAYVDNSLTNDVVVKKYNGSAWVALGPSTGIYGAHVCDPHLMIDNSGTPILSYQDYSNPTIIVQKFNGSNWVNIGAPGFAGNAGKHATALGPTGKPYVLYADNNAAGYATVKSFNGSSWVTIGNASFSAGTFQYPNIAVSSTGVPFVAYGDCHMANCPFTIMKYSGGNWVNVINTNSPYNPISQVYLALDQSGIPFVIYSDLNDVGKAKVAKIPGSSLTIIGDEGVSAERTDFTSVKINKQNEAFVLNCGYYTHELTVWRYRDTASGWVDIGPNFITNYGHYIDCMDLDTNGLPYVLYHSPGSMGYAGVKKYNGTNWVQVGIQGFSTNIPDYGTIHISKKGTPYIAYTDRNLSQNKMNVMKFDGNAWVMVGNANFSPGAAYEPSITTDKNDTPYVSFRTFGGMAYVMKLKGAIWDTVGSGQFASSVASPHISLDSSDTPYLCYSTLYNGASVMRYNGTNWSYVGNIYFNAAKTSGTTMLFDKNNSPNVAFIDQNGQIELWKYHNASWNMIAYPAADWASNVSIDLDTSGVPWVAYPASRVFVQKLGSLDKTVSLSGTTITANEPDATYQWMDCNTGNLLMSEINRSYTATVPGSYAVILTKGNCTDTSACIQITTTSIKTNLAESLSIYPNPGHEKVTLSMPANFKDIFTLQVLTMTGQEMLYMKDVCNSQPCKKEIDLTGFKPGLYAIRITYPGHSEVKKLMVN